MGNGEDLWQCTNTSRSQTCVCILYDKFSSSFLSIVSCILNGSIIAVSHHHTMAIKQTTKQYAVKTHIQVRSIAWVVCSFVHSYIYLCVCCLRKKYQLLVLFIRNKCEACTNITALWKYFCRKKNAGENESEKKLYGIYSHKKLYWIVCSLQWP